MTTQQDRIRRSNHLSLLSTGLALLIAFILLMVHQYVVGRSLMLDELHTESAIIGANSTAALVFDDPSAAQETVNAARLTPRITGAALYRANGVRLASLSSDGWTFPEMLAIAEADHKSKLFEVPSTTHYSAIEGVLREDIQVDGAPVGTLLLHVSFSWLYWRMAEYALGVIGIAAVASALAFRLTGGLRRRMVRAEEQLEQLAFYDPVTGLANRRLFERELRQAAARTARERTGAALLYVDVDDFKKVNDTLGHAVGDQVLKTIGERLLAILRSGDVVARLGGASLQSSFMALQTLRLRPGLRAR